MPNIAIGAPASPRSRPIAALLLGLSAMAAWPAYGDDPNTGSLADLSLEQLSNIVVTSASRQSEPLLEAATSIYVISAEDIRRSGANTLPEALRLAPNLQVARVGASTYAISARGFNNAIGNKLLVLVDGRTIYTPLFSGVFWDSQDVMLEDIERIEVISGPGATLWGANAVNGVINVITRRATDSQGNLVMAGGGNRETAGAVRHGGSFAEDGHYRIYAKGFGEFSTNFPGGVNAHDRFERAQVGFRADKGNSASNLTLQGDAYGGQSDADISGRPKLSGMNLLARWNRQLANDASVQVQAYYDHSERNDPYVYADRVDQYDLEVLHAFKPVAGQKFLWGAGYRDGRNNTYTHFSSPNPLPQAFQPARQSLQWANLFAQDEIALTQKLALTLGIKAEYNVFTHMEYLPNARVAWKFDADSVLWAAASRAVRAPAVLDRDFFLYVAQPNKPLLPLIVGGAGFQSEVAHVYELGYRAQPMSRASFSVTGFFSTWDKLRSGEPGPFAVVQNQMYGSTEGIEAWGTYHALPSWRLSAGVLALRENLKIRPGSPDPTGPKALGNDPSAQWQVRSTHDLADNVELDLALRHVGRLPNPVIAAYTAFDLRLAWQVNRSLELSLNGQNLLDAHHLEFNGNLATLATEVDRSVFLRVLWRTP